MPKPRKEKQKSGNSPVMRVTDFWWAVKRSPLPYMLILLVFFVGWYVFLYWGYHNSKFSYKFDNFVQETGVWKLFGAKRYERDKGNYYIADPRLTWIDRYYRKEISSGTIVSLDPEDQKFSIDHPDGVLRMVAHSDTHINMITDGEVRYCPGCTLDSLSVGDYVKIINITEIDYEQGQVEAGNLFIEKYIDEQ